MQINKGLIVAGVAVVILIMVVYIYNSTQVLNKLDILSKKVKATEEKQTIIENNTTT